MARHSACLFYIYCMKRKKKFEVPIEILELEPNNYHVILNAQIEKNRIVLLIDTGASKTVFNSSLPEIDYENHSSIENPEIKTAGISEGNIETSLGIVHHLIIEDFLLDEFEVATLSLDYINSLYAQFSSTKIDGLIGSDFLKEFEAILNYRNQTLTLYK